MHPPRNEEEELYQDALKGLINLRVPPLEPNPPVTMSSRANKAIMAKQLDTSPVRLVRQNAPVVVPDSPEAQGRRAIRQYTRPPELPQRGPKAVWFGRGKNEESVSMPLDELVKEHTHLVKVLKDMKSEPIKKELQKQTKELKKYIGMVRKSKGRGGGLLDIFNKQKVINELVNPDSILRRRVSDVSRGIRTNYPPSSRKVIDKYGDWKIESLTLRRDPVQSALHVAFQLVTLGQWNKARASENKEKLFHLGIVLGLVSPNGEKASVLVEKNEVINIGMPKKTTGGTEIVSSTAPVGETLRTFLDKGLNSVGAEQFFKYDPFKNNCQDFILLLLRANGVITPSAEAFVKQDVNGLLNKLPSWTGAIAKGITDIGGLANVAIEGGKIKYADKEMGKQKNWIQGVVANMEKGAFTKQSRRKGMTPEEYANEVLAHPEEHTLKTRRRSQFVKNVRGGVLENCFPFLGAVGTVLDNVLNAPSRRGRVVANPMRRSEDEELQRKEREYDANRLSSYNMLFPSSRPEVVVINPFREERKRRVLEKATRGLGGLPLTPAEDDLLEEIRNERQAKSISGFGKRGGMCFRRNRNYRPVTTVNPVPVTRPIGITWGPATRPIGPRPANIQDSEENPPTVIEVMDETDVSIEDPKGLDGKGKRGGMCFPRRRRQIQPVVEEESSSSSSDEDPEKARTASDPKGDIEGRGKNSGYVRKMVAMKKLDITKVSNPSENLIEIAESYLKSLPPGSAPLMKEDFGREESMSIAPLTAKAVTKKEPEYFYGMKHGWLTDTKAKALGLKPKGKK